MPRKKKVDDSVVLKQILEVITKIGATSFSLMDLSKKTGLSPATLLQRFGSKKNILHKALTLANENLNQDLISRRSDSQSVIQTIIDIYLELATMFVTPQDVANGLEVLKFDITDKKLNKLTRDYFEIRRHNIEAQLRLAKEKNEIAAQVDVKAMTYTLEALWQGSVMLWALIGKGSLHHWLAKQLHSFFEQQQV